MQTVESLIFDYLTTYRDTINLVGLAKRVQTSRTTLSKYLDGERGLSAPLQQRLLEHYKPQAALLAAIMKAST